MSKSLEQLQPTVVRTERGLSINGTRITLYRPDGPSPGRAARPRKFGSGSPAAEQQVAAAHQVYRGPPCRGGGQVHILKNAAGDVFGRRGTGISSSKSRRCHQSRSTRRHGRSCKR